jgi:folylpolyglutamate synthase/dihydropteroate synthase
MERFPNILFVIFDKNKTFLNQMTLVFFEMSVRMAFDYFAKKSGYRHYRSWMGGRLDATKYHSTNPIGHY